MKLPQKKQDELHAFVNANNALVTALVALNANTLKYNKLHGVDEFTQQLTQTTNLYNVLEKVLDDFTKAGDAFYDGLTDTIINNGLAQEAIWDMLKFFGQFGGTQDDE